MFYFVSSKPPNFGRSLYYIHCINHYKYNHSNTNCFETVTDRQKSRSLEFWTSQLWKVVSIFYFLFRWFLIWLHLVSWYHTCRLILSATRCRPTITLVSEHADIHEGSSGMGRQTTVGLSTTTIFHRPISNYFQSPTRELTTIWRM